MMIDGKQKVTFEEMFHVDGDGKYATIEFDKIFKIDELKRYSSFNLGLRRTFINMSEQIIDAYKMILNEMIDFGKDEKSTEIDKREVFLLNVLHAQTEILSNRAKNINDLYALLDKILLSEDGNLIELVTKYVNDNFNEVNDILSEETKNSSKTFDVKLKLSDSQIKTYIMIGYCSKILIPIISNFFTINKAVYPKKIDTSVMVDSSEQDDDYDDLDAKDAEVLVFQHVFDVVAGDPAKHLRRKLYVFIESRVKRMMKQTNRYMEYSKNQGITVPTTCNKLYYHLLTNTIPKVLLTEDLNFAGYIQGIVRNRVQFQASTKFENRVDVLDINTAGDEDDSKITEFDKLEIRVKRKNEGESIIQDMIIDEVIRELPTLMDVPISDDEVRYHERYVKINEVQTTIISMILGRYFEDTTIARKMNSHQYAIALVCTMKFLRIHKMINLADIMVATCANVSERSVMSGGKITLNIKNSKRYTDLFDKKYANFRDKIEKSLTYLIATIHANKFLDSEGESVFKNRKTAPTAAMFAEELVMFAWLI